MSYKTIIHLDPHNIEEGVRIYIPDELLQTKDEVELTVLYYNVGFEEPVYEHSRYVLNAWFYSPDYNGYFDAEFPFKFFLFPINDSSNLQNTYSAKFKLNKTFITLSIRDMVYANELPQNYKEDFTLTAVIELK